MKIFDQEVGTGNLKSEFSHWIEILVGAAVHTHTKTQEKNPN